MILNKINNIHFSESEKTILRYILRMGENIENMTTQDIANATYTSAPLCIRISKKLGYDGWTHFKKALVFELKYLYADVDVDASIPFVVNDDLTTIAQNILKLRKDTIEDTKDLMSHDDLSKAVSLLRKADVIDIYAKDSYSYLAEGFKQKMFAIKKTVNVTQDSGNAILQAAMSDESHVAIVISYSGETVSTLKCTYKAKSKNTPIIAITSISLSSLSKLADVSLKMSSKEMLNTKIGDFATSESIACILDVLYAAVFSFDYDLNLDYKLSLAKEIDDSFTDYEYINDFSPD